MRLNVVPPRTGLLWAQQGIRTFLRQPLALSGLFFMLWAAIFVVSIVPVAGILAALVLIPAGTLGLMSAAEKVGRGVFPMPPTLVEGLRGPQARQLLLLGVINAAVVIAIVLAVSALVSNEPLGGAPREQGQLGVLSPAAIVASLLQLPVTVLFTIAPGLVHWHGVPAVKALFFSAIAFGRNLGAWLVFGACWTGLMLGVMLAVGLVVQLLGGGAAVGVVAGVGLTLLAALSASLYFPFRDSFAADAPAATEGATE